MSTLKNYGTPNEMARVKYIAKDFNDLDNPYIGHDTSALCASSIKPILSAAAVHGFNLFWHDVAKAHL